MVYDILDVRSLAVASRPRQSFCVHNSGDMSQIIKGITIEQAYIVMTSKRKHVGRAEFLASQN